jgi:hypothetical protein
MANTSEISTLVQEAIQNLPPDQCESSAEVDQSGNEFIEIRPKNPCAARIRILNEPGCEYAVVLGRGTVIELPLPGKAFAGLSTRDEFLQVCKAVIEGGLTERIVSLFGRDLFILGWLKIRNQTIRSMSGVPLPYPFWRKVKYEPYAR